MTLPPFLERIKDDVIKAKRETGSKLKVSIAMAQCALESDYGQSELARNANNFAGNKYDKNIYKDFYIKDAYEYENGQEIVDENAKWGKYTDFNDFCKSHFNWFTSNATRTKLYANVLSATTADRQAYYLMGTYATDLPRPNSIGYYRKLMNIINAYNLTQYDVEEEQEKEIIKMPKILLIAGHGPNKSNGYFDAGATGYVPQGEHKWYRDEVFPAMKKYLPANADVVFFSDYNVYSQNNIVALAKSYGTDTVVIECHFDSGGVAYSKAGGHVIIYKDYEPDALDIRLRDAIKATVGLHPNYNNGISKRNDLRNVNATASGGINYRLIEWGMSSHRENGLYMVNNVDTIARAFVNAIFGEVKSNVPAPTPVDVTDPNNPQGMKETTPAPYKAPRLPFDDVNVGDTVTLLDNRNSDGKLIWQWYKPATDKQPHAMLLSPRQEELAGATDVVVEIKKIERIQNSEYAIKLKDFNSWILQEYLEESYASWEEVEDELEEPSEEHVSYDGNFVQIFGKRYKIAEEITE